MKNAHDFTLTLRHRPEARPYKPRKSRALWEERHDMNHRLGEGVITAVSKPQSSAHDGPAG